MRLYEFQAKDLLKKFGIPIPAGRVCEDVSAVAEAYLEFGPNVGLKSQVLSGGRGKAGGIRFASSLDEARSMAEAIIGSSIKDLLVSSVLVEERVAIASEYYLGIIHDADPKYSRPLVMFSARGGMEIEEVVQQDPAALKRCHVDPSFGLNAFEAIGLFKEAQIPSHLLGNLARIAQSFYRLFWEMDGEMVEINPLVLTEDGKLLAVDARISIDSNALFRHSEIKRNFTNPREEEAALRGISYVELDGNVGVIANGAGLGMATMDLVRSAGGHPANFLDPGSELNRPGGMTTAVKVLRDNPNVEVILVNVFGGGIRCELVANGLLEAFESIPDLGLPVVVCLRGRNEDEGNAIIQTSTYPQLRIVPSMEEAVNAAVEGGRAK